MTSYLGIRCPVCNKKFGESDDIVVCPVCGAPHHRECYFIKGECALLEEHKSGKEWRPPFEPGGAGGDVSGRVCSACNRQSPGLSLFCNHCGLRFDEAASGDSNSYENASGGMPWPWPGVPPFGSAYTGVEDTETIGELTAREYAVYVGNRSDYYLPRFKMAARSERQFSINIPALILGFPFFFYRKMYLVGSLLLLFWIIVMAFRLMYMIEIFPIFVDQINARDMLEVSGMVIGAHEDVNQALAMRYYNIANALNTINFTLHVFLSLIANRLYYQQATREIHRVRQMFGADSATAKIRDTENYEAALAGTGGHNLAVSIAIVVGVFVFLAVVSFVLVPLILFPVK